MVLASVSTFSGKAVRTPSGGEGLPKVCFRRKSRFGHLRRHFSSVCGSSSHVRSVARSSKWAYVLRSGVCLDCRLSRRTASVRLEAAMQSAFQEKFSYTMTVRGLFGQGVGDGAPNEGFRSDQGDGCTYIKLASKRQAHLLFEKFPTHFDRIFY